MSGEKEAAYDQHIAPLMAEIISLCKLHKINMAAQFVLDADNADDPDSRLLCTTVLPCDPSDAVGARRVHELRHVMYSPPSFVALAITNPNAR